MQHERIRISAQLCNDERGFVRHQTADEMDVATEPVELGNDDGGLVLLCCLQCRGELRSAIERIGALASLDLIERLQQVVAFSLSEPGERLLLGLEAKARLA